MQKTCHNILLPSKPGSNNACVLLRRLIHPLPPCISSPTPFLAAASSFPLSYPSYFTGSVAVLLPPSTHGIPPPPPAPPLPPYSPLLLCLPLSPEYGQHLSVHGEFNKEQFRCYVVRYGCDEAGRGRGGYILFVRLKIDAWRDGYRVIEIVSSQRHR